MYTKHGLPRSIPGPFYLQTPDLFQTDATVIIQGAVDLAFVEDGKLVIVDYKTDRVKDITKLAGLYKKQLYLYKSAMEQSEELTVKECILCSIHLGVYITV